MQFAIPLSKHGEPLSRQIYLWLRRAVLEGTLRPGERLPATRDLAEQLRVSRTVVVLAYEQLLAEGFVLGRAGSGTYVAEALGASTRASRAATSRAGVGASGGSGGSGGARNVEVAAKLKLSRFGAAAAAAAATMEYPRQDTVHFLAPFLREKGKTAPPASTLRPATLRYDFTYRRSPVETFPFETWRRILIRRARQAPVRAFNYGQAAGSLALREAIAAHLRRSRAVVCDASQVIVVNGSQQALDLVARVIMEPGDRVVIEDPHYQGAREIFRATGARLHAVPVDRDGLDPEKLPARARLAFVTPSHQFPTGTILPLARRLALLEWARRANAIVIEDDYDGEFRYEGQPVESMQGLDTDGRVIYVGTFSRTIFPALRIGYLIAPKSLVSALMAAKWLCDRHTATLEQETLAEFIANGAYERHLRRARRANAIRRRALMDAIQQYLGDRVEVTGDGSGTHVVLWPATREPEAVLMARAAAHGVGVYGISGYYFAKPRRAGLLLGYSGMKEQEIREGIKKLGETMR